MSIYLFGNTQEDSYFTCRIPNDIMLTYLLTEQTKKRDLYYPFILQINYSKEKSPEKFENVRNIILQIRGNEALNSKLYDCKNLQQCISTVEALEQNGYMNYDIGPFQVNYYFNKNDLRYMFNFYGSYLLSCQYVTKLILENGYSLDTLGMYNSKTPENKAKYLAAWVENYKLVNKSRED